MKIVSAIARYLLVLMFLVFGLNGFLHFIPSPPMPGVAGQFMTAISVSHYADVVFAVQLISAILLLINRYVPLGLTLLGPVIVNIVCFHAFMQPGGLPLALVVVVLWILAAYRVRTAFMPLLRPQAAP